MRLQRSIKFALLLTFMGFLTAVAGIIAERASAQVRVSPVWQELGDGPSNSSEVAATVDTAGTLHIVTVRDAGAAGFAYDYRSINDQGVMTAPQTILSGWLGLSYPALLRRADGSLSVLFFGNRSGNTSDPYSGYSLYRVTSDSSRISWSLDSTVYDGAPGLSGQSANSGALFRGTEEVAVSIQGGTVRAFNIASSVAVQSAAKPCCAYSAAAAVVPRSGDFVAGFYSNATAQGGVFFQTLFPSTGSLWQAPGAELDTRVRVPMVARDGELYTTYAYGSRAEGVRVWKIGDDQNAYVDIPGSKGAIGATLASDGTRLWAVWGVADGSTVTYVARSNATATRFGLPIRVAGPPRSTAIFNRSAEGARGHLDLFATSDGPSSGIQSLYARIGIPLEVKVRPARVSRGGGAVRITVTDGDLPVANARVRGGGGSARTNARGQARLLLTASRASITVTATKAGYTPGSATVRRG